MKFEWEQLTAHGEMETCRAKVYGGWIVRTVCWTKAWANTPQDVAESMVFVPDPDHKWVVDSVSS